MTGTRERVATRREGITLGRVAGIPIILAYSWFVVAAFTVAVFGPQVQRAFGGIGVWAYIVAFAYAVLLLFSVLVHELSHAVAAKLYRWPTHRIVLNLWGGHTEFDFGKATPGRAVVVAFAGPISNFLLAGLVYLLLLAAPPGTTLSLAILNLLGNIFIWANLLIGGFNVLPGLPLDGGRLVEAIVWKSTGSQERGTVAAGWAGRIIVVLMVLVGLGLPVLWRGTPDLTTTVVTLMLAGFLWMGASQAITGARIRLRMPGIQAGRLALPALGVPAAASVAQLWGLRGAHPSAALVLCSAEGRPIAVVDESSLAHVPPAVAASTPASSVGRALAPGSYVPDNAVGMDLVDYLSQLGGTEYAVIDSRGQVTGLLHQDTVVSALKGR